MTTRHPHQGEPALIHSLTEWRALAEMALLPYALPWLVQTPRGDGHPVLLLPGFMADEASLLVLKAFLRQRGHDVQTWGFGRNVGFSTRHARALEQKIRFLHHHSGRRVSLVGWSLGGVFALYGAHQAPECVRSVITLGSPVSVDPQGSQSPRVVKALYRLIAHPLGPDAHALQPRAKKLREPKTLPVHVSCLYSLGDGVVPPQEATIHGDPALLENIRVAGSHAGLGFNPMVLAIVADRLAQPEGAWKPFRPAGWWASAYRFATHGAAAPSPARSGLAAAGPAPAGGRPAVPGSSRGRTAQTRPGPASARGRRSAKR
jgi:pimeloyl-ACP methyl ester carboxylesterase